MTVKLLIEHLLGFLSLKGDCTSSSESIIIKMSHCWKSHIAAQICFEWELRKVSFNYTFLSREGPGIYLLLVG